MPTSKPSQYVGPTDIVERHSKVWLYDSGSGELIAELSPEAAATVRRGHADRLIFDGHTLMTESEAA